MTCRVARKWWSSQSGSLWHHRCCHSLAELDPLPRDGSGQIMPSEDIKLPFYMERVKDPREFGGIYVYIVTSSTSRGKDERKLSRWKNEIRRDWVCSHYVRTCTINIIGNSNMHCQMDLRIHKPKVLLHYDAHLAKRMKNRHRPNKMSKSHCDIWNLTVFKDV